jgi:hypothetical protein
MFFSYFFFLNQNNNGIYLYNPWDITTNEKKKKKCK